LANFDQATLRVIWFCWACFWVANGRSHLTCRGCGSNHRSCLTAGVTSERWKHSLECHSLPTTAGIRILTSALRLTRSKPRLSSQKKNGGSCKSGWRDCKANPRLRMKLYPNWLPRTVAAGPQWGRWLHRLVRSFACQLVQGDKSAPGHHPKWEEELSR